MREDSPVPVSRVETEIGHQKLSLETGKIAKQAHGAVVVTYGETVVLVASVQGNPVEGRDFFPLQVEYRERQYAAGKFPGGYIKREGKPTIKETLTSRLIDRPIRPLFPKGFTNEIQITATVLSADRDNDPDILAMIGASAALHISHSPLLKPISGIRIGRVGGQLIPFPTHAQMEESDLDLVVASTRDAVCMIEGFAREMLEDQMADAIMFAYRENLKVIQLIEDLRTQMGLPPKEFPPPPPENPLIAEFYAKHKDEFRERKLTPGKQERAAKVQELYQRLEAEYTAILENDQPKYTANQVAEAFEALSDRVFRDLALEGQRIDGRGLKEIRPLSCEVHILPRAHGSALFQRGETQALVVTTLGTGADEQKVEGLLEDISKKFMLDYNFPPFSVGECKPMRGPGRREIGHGMLAERSLKAVIPSPQKFPYTIRIVSEIMESNGSSSMATVCGGTLSLMDAGVPISNPVAGISIGLVKEPDKFILLTDIQGDEDHFGDMDFKVAGTQRGITGIQLDLKVDGIEEPIIRATLEQAREARREILRAMLSALRQPRGQISDHAPRLLQVKIPREKIGYLIGAGGKTIKGIQEETGAKIDIDDDGTVSITHYDASGAEAAKRCVLSLTEEIKVGKVYEGRVTSIKDFGAFVEILPGRDGLCHISELDDKYVGRVDEVVKVGDRMMVKVIAIDDQDRVKLSRRVLLKEQAAARLEEAPPPPAARERDPRSSASGRPERMDRPERSERSERGEYRDRDDRGSRRGERSERGEREPRGNR